MSVNKLIDLDLLDQFSSGFKTYIDQKIETAVAAGTVDLVAGVEIVDGVLFVTQKNGTRRHYIITTPCTVCATQTNTASTEDIQAMLASTDEGTATGEPITNVAGCSIATVSEDDIDTMVNDPENLVTTTDENTFYTDCPAETATEEETMAAVTEATEYTSPTMSIPEEETTGEEETTSTDEGEETTTE